MSLHAPKTEQSKDRITLVVAASLVEEKLPLCLIRKEVQPQQFNKRAHDELKDSNNLFYANKQDTACMTRTTFWEYLNYLNSIFISQNTRL